MVIQDTQVPMYTNIHCFCIFLIFQFFLFLYEKQNKAKTEKKTNKNMLNKVMYKTGCKCMRKEEEKRRSIHEDNTNVLVKEFKPFAIKRFGKKICLLIISVNEPKSKSTIFDKLPNEVMLNLYVFNSRMLNRILRDVYGTSIVAVDGKMLLTNTIIMEEFLHP